MQRCFGRLTDAWRSQFPDAVELPRWGDLLRQNVAIFDLDFDAILAAMYALTDSAEGDCYLSVPPDPGIEAAALGASASVAPGTGESAAPCAAPHSRRLVGLSQSPWLTRLGALSLRTLPRFYRVLAQSGLLSGLHLPSFSTNLVSGADLQDVWVDQFAPGGQRVTHCTCSWTGRHLAKFTRRPGSSLYTLTTASPPVSVPGQVAASSQVFTAASMSQDRISTRECCTKDRTTLTPLSRPVAVSLADPSGGPVLASFSTVLPCPAAPSGSLSGLYLPSFSTNLVSGADLQDQGVDQFTPASQRVTHCTDARTGRHLATFTRRPGSSLYTLSTESPPVSASGQVAASSQVLAAASGSGPESAPCSCRLLSHQTLLWHHRLGHPSLLRLRGMASRVLVSGLPRSLPPLPPGPASTCVPCVEGRQRAAPHSSEFPPTEAPLQTLHMDVWGPARVRGQGHERYFLLVVDDYSRYTTVFPLRSKGEVTEVLIDWIRAARLRLRESFGSDFPVLRLHSDRGGEFSSARLGAFCRAQCTLSTASPLVPASGQVAASIQVFAAASGSGPESAPCLCRLLSHQTLLWHHRLGHPSLPRLQGMASRVLVSGLPRSLPPLPPGPAPTCVPCVEGRQRAAPHSSEFPPTEAPLQTLHMDVWGPARVYGQGHERYFLLVVDDYSRYTTVFPLRSKGEVTEVLIDWIRAARLRLREIFGSDFPVLRLHSDKGGEFSSARLGAFCRAQGIRETFTLPASPHQNGIAERRIGMVMDVARTSMIHAAAPHFLWPFAVQYAAHQLNLQPRVSLPETSPTLRWTGKFGDASAFRVWGSRAFVRDLSADKLSPRAVPCVFLGFPPDAPGWKFYHPTSHRVLSSQDVTFDESVPYYRLFPYRTASLPPPPLFLAPGPPPLDPLPPQGPAPSDVSQVDAIEPVEVAVDSGAATGAEPAFAGSGGTGSGSAETGGAEPGGAESGGAETWGAEPGGAATGGTEPGGAEPGVTEPGGAEPGGAGSARVASRGASSRREVLSPQELREWFARRWGRAAGAGGTTATTCPGGAGAAGPGGSAETAGVGPTGGSARASGGTGAIGCAGPGAAGATGATGVGAAGGVGAGGSADAGTSEGAGAGAAGAGGATGAGAPAGSPGAVPAGSGGTPRPRPYFVPLLEQVLGLPPSLGFAPSFACPQPVQSQSLLQPVSPLPAPSPYTGPTGSLAERRAPASCPASPARPACTRRRTSRPCPPAVPGTHQMALRPSTASLRVPLPSPPASSLPAFPDPESDSLRAASPTVARFLATVVTDPSLASTAASALVAELVEFAASCRLDYAARLVAESASVCPPSVGGECALSTDVLEDRQEEFQCFAGALPHLVSTLLAPEGDPDAPDIPTPRSYAEAIEGPYSSQWQAPMDAKMASWKSTGTYVDEVPPPGANIVSGMWIFRVKRLPGSPPVFKARYVARGFSQRQGVDYFQTFSCTELRWLTCLLTDLGEQPRSPPLLYVDNKAMLALCREHRLEHRTKHIALRYFLARELQQRRQLRLAYVASEANTADIFTKALAPGDHQRFCTLLACFALLDWSFDLLFSPTWPMGVFLLVPNSFASSSIPVSSQS
ncbi:unnamed protein product [Closterium sp. NIES-53]